MKWREGAVVARHVLGAVLVVVGLGAGCSSGSSSGDSGPAQIAETPAQVEASTEVVPSEVPTEAVLVSVSDDERIGAVEAGLAASGVESLVAWDLLGSSVGVADSEGVALVSMTLCGWSGDSVFDAVWVSNWETSIGADGDVAAVEVSSSLTAGECLNTELIDSALDTIVAHDEMWARVLLDPGSFPDDPDAPGLFSEAQFAIAETAAAEWAADGIQVRSTSFGMPIDEPGALLNDIVWRRHSLTEPDGVLDIVVCRAMMEGYGFYRGDLLLDNFRETENAGDHSIRSYRMLIDPSSALGWRVDARHGLGWSDCLSVDDWPAAASTWRPAPVDFERLNS